MIFQISCYKPTYYFLQTFFIQIIKQKSGKNQMVELVIQSIIRDRKEVPGTEIGPAVQNRDLENLLGKGLGKAQDPQLEGEGVRIEKLRVRPRDLEDLGNLEFFKDFHEL